LKVILSIIVPFFNEEKGVKEFHNNLVESLNWIEKYEIIFINDGSTDYTLQIIKEIAGSDNLKYLSFSRNFGHQSAITAGINHAVGDYIVIMDGDGQDPPELLQELYAKAQEGFDVVYAKRKKRKGESFFKKVTASIFYRLLKKLTSVDIPVDTGDFRIISRRIKLEFEKMNETNKFIRGMVSWVGYKQTYIEYDRVERKVGETKFGFSKMFNFAVDGLTSFSTVPLKLILYLGVITSVISFFLILIALLTFLFGQTVRGWTSMQISILFFSGIQLFSLGLIGQYLGRIFDEVRNRPYYIVEESNIKSHTR
jgi:glycosyltransferase involved in cell wall biosynthesis